MSTHRGAVIEFKLVMCACSARCATSLLALFPCHGTGTCLPEKKGDVPHGSVMQKTRQVFAAEKSSATHRKGCQIGKAKRLHR